MIRKIVTVKQMAAAVAAASQTKPQTEDLSLKKIHKINAMLHQLPEAGGLAKGPCQQGVLHPDGAVRVGGVSPLLARADTVFFSWGLTGKIFTTKKNFTFLTGRWFSSKKTSWFHSKRNCELY